MEPVRLNLGCGTTILKNWVNLDIAQLPGVDVVHDITKLPLPFGDKSVDEVLCQDVLEHMDYIPVLKDIHRILKPGGKVAIRVPHFTSKHNFIDPTHKKMFSINTFDFFVKGSSEQGDRGYYFDFAFTSSEKNTIRFERDSIVFLLNPAIEALVNLSPSIQRVYESTGWSRIFPAGNILVTLVK